jgi:ATP-binding cassette subfamily B protein
MDRGRVVEVGPHDELMANRGAYWRLYEAQLRRVEEKDVEATAIPVAEHAAHPAGGG